jgi:hypothetical protein
MIRRRAVILRRAGVIALEAAGAGVGIVSFGMMLISILSRQPESKRLLRSAHLRTTLGSGFVQIGMDYQLASVPAGP